MCVCIYIGLHTTCEDQKKLKKEERVRQIKPKIFFSDSLFLKITKLLLQFCPFTMEKP